MPLPPGIAEGPFPGSCAHMAYIPRSPMAFPGDLQHDFRDFQNDQRLDTIGRWIGFAADIYLRAARMLDQTNDPIADCLGNASHYDARTVWASHDHLAQHWRAVWLPRARAGKHLQPEWPYTCVPIHSYRDLQDAFHIWLLEETLHWSRVNAPRFRAFCRSVARDHSRAGIVDESNFYFDIRAAYPVPGQAR